MMTRTAFLLIPFLCATALSGVASAQGDELNLPADSRVKLLMYDESDIYRIPTRYGYQTNIVFGRGEALETISMGDRSMWQIIPSGNRLFIRPMHENVKTNMTILTNKHSYQFDLESGAGEDAEVIYVARFVYPNEKKGPRPPMAVSAPLPPPVMAAPAMAAAPPAPGALPFEVKAPARPGQPPLPAASGPGITEPVHHNYNYTFSGPDELAPLQVYDDGHSTYIRFEDMAEALPNVYLIDDAGTEKPVAYRLKEEIMVVDLVAPELVLRSSSGAVTVYNELINPQVMTK